MAVNQCIFFSDVLQKKTAMNVLLPDSGTMDTCPVLYLLHGMDGNYTTWLAETRIEAFAAQAGFAVVMPDAENSFYNDMAAGPRYETFFREELPARVRCWFGLGGDPARTHIAGLSMGGFGAMRLAFLQPGRFSTAASFSGCLDFAAFERAPLKPAQQKVHRTVFGENTRIAGSDNDLLALMERVAPLPAMYQFCGREDFLYEQNQSFRRRAEALHAPLTYREGPGGHTWDVWNAELDHYFPWLIKQAEEAKTCVR